ncbi:MAG: DUF1704 domain-containing protein [Candidatus Woesearchaeota archaeon]|nr:MAG: DUF1704 domain-containing protein [Candidatus Woesearchaeota archaeon]
MDSHYLSALAHVFRVAINKLRFVNPLNAGEEKKQFFSSTTYNPQFVYPPLTYHRERIDKELALLESYEGFEKDILQAFVKRARVHLSLKDAVGTENFSQISKDVFGDVDPKIIPLAQELARRSVVCEEKTLKASHVRVLFDAHLPADWKATLSFRTSAKIVLSQEQCQLIIDPEALFSEHDVERLLVHEVGAHISRGLRHADLSPKFLQYLFLDYSETEEGLAVYLEELEGVQDPWQQKIYALRFLGTVFAETHSFRETYDYLLSFGIDVDEAYRLTQRLKRGLIDTAKPGAFYREKIYLQGSLAVKAYVASTPDPHATVKFLLAGKFGLADIPLLESYAKNNNFYK